MVRECECECEFSMPPKVITCFHSPPFKYAKFYWVYFIFNHLMPQRCQSLIWCKYTNYIYIVLFVFFESPIHDSFYVFDMCWWYYYTIYNRRAGLLFTVQLTKFSAFLMHLNYINSLIFYFYNWNRGFELLLNDAVRRIRCLKLLW